MAKNITREKGDTKRISLTMRDKNGVVIPINAWTNFRMHIDKYEYPIDDENRNNSCAGFYLNDKGNVRLSSFSSGGIKYHIISQKTDIAHTNSTEVGLDDKIDFKPKAILLAMKMSGRKTFRTIQYLSEVLVEGTNLKGLIIVPSISLVENVIGCVDNSTFVNVFMLVNNLFISLINKNVGVFMFLLLLI